MAKASLFHFLIVLLCIANNGNDCLTLKFPKSTVSPNDKADTSDGHGNYTVTDNKTTSSPGLHHKGQKKCDPYDHCEGGNETEHGIHLVSIKYKYVEQPLIISVFLFAAGLAKLGGYIFDKQKVFYWNITPINVRHNYMFLRVVWNPTSQVNR